MPGMTASTTRCSTSPSERRAGSLLAWLQALLLGVLVILSLSARAEEVTISYAALQSREDGYSLDVDIDLTLNARLEDAIQHGVALHFVLEAEITQPRWYWFDQSLIGRRLEYRLSYQPITRKYRLNIGSLYRNFDSLETAVQAMQRTRNWLIAPNGTLRNGRSYDAAVRFRLDLNQLPKPFQLTAIGSSDWTLESDWMRWTFLAAPPEQP